MKRTSAALVASALAGLLLFAGLAAAAPGDLDTTFSGDGFTALNLGEYEGADDISAAPDGKVVVGGDTELAHKLTPFIARTNADGSPDLSFGTGGVRYIAPPCGEETGIDDVAVLPDGKILAAGECEGDFLLMRFNADGSDDLGFDGDPGNPGGGNGYVRTSFAEDASVFGMVVDPADGSILLGGPCCQGNPVQGEDSTFARYGADGRLDPEFDGTPLNTAGGNGKVTIPLSKSSDRPDELVLAGGGSFAFTGQIKDSTFVALVNVHGEPVKSFSGDGLVEIDYSPFRSKGLALAFDGSGLIVASEVEEEGYEGTTRVARLDMSGKLDPAFAQQSFNPTPGLGDFPLDLEIQANGRLLVLAVGEYSNGGGSSPGVVELFRMLPGGQPDTEFGPGGIRRFAGPNETSVGVALAFDALGRALVTGRTEPVDPPTAKTDVLIARFKTENDPPAKAAPPSNLFKFAGFRRNQKNGTATIFIEVPGPGLLSLAKTKKLKGATKSPGKAGKFGLPLKLKGKAKVRQQVLAALKGKARTKIRAAVTYTPTGGVPSTQSKKLKLFRTR